jgi:hypothetical protein
VLDLTDHHPTNSLQYMFGKWNNDREEAMASAAGS